MKIVFLSLFAFICIVVNAQRPIGNMPPMGEMSSGGVIVGMIKDSVANHNVEYASVVLYKAKDSTMLTGVLSDSLGRFMIKEVPNGNYFLEISFIGYKKLKIRNVIINAKQPFVKMGMIKLTPSSISLNEVEITADKPMVEYKIDKKVINVNQDIISSGGTAVEVLENSPSIQTDIEGNVTLRGSGSFKVLIDGKPSILQGSDALRQIPASTIQNIELITNPSAKYDPDGTAGIINVVLRKEKRDGFNGIVNLTVGTQDKYSGDFLLNIRAKKMNYFFGADYSDNKHYMERKSDRRIYSLLDTLFQINKAKGNMFRNNKGIKGGFDYSLSDKTSFSLSANFSMPEHGRTFLAKNNEYHSFGLNNKYILNDNTSFEENTDYGGTLNFTHKFKGENNKIEALAYYSNGSGTDNDETKESLSNSNWERIYDPFFNTKTYEKFNDQSIRLKTDYTLVLNENRRLEAGYQSDFDKDNSNYVYTEFDVALNQWFEDPNQSNDFNFHHNIHSVYSTYSDKLIGIGYQIGLRGEYTDRLMNQLTLNKKFENKGFDYFPSIHLSKQLPFEQQIMLSYTRRINRPDEHDLNPFISYYDRKSARTGNPELDNEYMDSYELGYQKRFMKVAFVSIDAYHRHTKNKIERQLSILNDSISLMTYQNVNDDYSTGIEMMLNMPLAKWWLINMTGTFFNYRIVDKSSKDSLEISQTNTWNIRASSIFKLNWGMRIQLMGFYSAPSITSQGTRSDMLMTSIGIRQDILKKKANLTLQVQDVLNSMKMHLTSSDQNFYSDFIMTHRGPTFMLTFTYRINNYKQQSRKGMNGGDDSIEMDFRGGGDGM